MNDLRIYAQVAQKPGIGASEIANNLGMTLATISADLRMLVDAGHLVRTRAVHGETQRDYQAYTLSDDFKASRTYKALLDQLETVFQGTPETSGTVKLPDPAPAPVATVLSAEFREAERSAAPAPTPASAAPAVRHGPGMSKVDRAMVYIQTNGQATSEQLAKVMEIENKAHVSTYLAKPRAAGRVHSVDGIWKLGTGSTETSNVEVVGNVIVATRDQTPVPAEVKAAVVEMATAAAMELRKPEPEPAAVPPAKPAARAYRCAIWSDGSVEIEKGHFRIILTQNELTEISDFMAMRRVA